MSDLRDISEGSKYGERIAALETKLEDDEKSFLRRFGAIGGIVALVISIAMGLIGFADRVYFQRIEDPEKTSAELCAITARITEINWKLAEHVDPTSINSQLVAKIANGEKISLVERANRLSATLSYDLGFAELIILSGESLNFGMADAASHYARVAIQQSDIPSFKSEAKRLLARSTFAPGKNSDPEAARVLFREAITIGTQSSNLAAQFAARNAYGDWIMSEVIYENCQEAKDLLTEARNETGLTEHEVAYYLANSPITSGKCAGLEGN